MTEPNRQAALRKALLQVDLEALVNELFETTVLDQFFAEHPCNGRELGKAAKNMKLETRGRLAALILLYRSHDPVYEAIDADTKARTYCDAFAEDVMKHDEPWGTLWWSDDTGMLGYHIVQQGEAAIHSLTRLLDDTRLRDRYSGGERAAELSIRGYRVKDFAAFYIAKIRKYDLPWKSVMEERDEAINQMRRELGR